jgi:hypothetical protein
MSIYAAQGTSAVAGRTALILVSTATIRPRILEYVLGQLGTPSGDGAIEVTVKRFTVAGTTTAVTPASTDSGDPASTLTAGSNATVEPTYTSNTTMADVTYNPRTIYRWTAYDQRAELIMPATAANGIGFLVAGLGSGITITADVKALQ